MTLADLALADGSSLAPSRRRRGGGRTLRRFWKDAGAVTGAVILGVLFLALALAPWTGLDDPLAVNVPDRLAQPSWDHPLGTDGLGRDMLSRMLYGGRASVALTMAVTVIATTVGVLLGVAAGMRGGFIDGAIMRVVELVQAVPLIIVAMVAIKLLGGGPATLVGVLAGLGWTGQARVVRAATLSLRERDFIESCRVIGGSRLRIALRHVVPNLLSPVVVLATLEVGRVLLALSTLSFLGFGARPPQPEWGSMLAEARSYFFVAPVLLIIPGVAIFLVALSANLFGEGLHDAFEVKRVKK